MMQDLHMDYDIKFEWLACYLASKFEVSLEEIYAQPIGIFNRFVNHDVEQAFYYKDQYEHGVYFKLNREGLYDTLPHAMFHQSASYKEYTTDIKKIKSELEKANDIERDARLFFKIFEEELLRTNCYVKQFQMDCDLLDYGPVQEVIAQLLPFDSAIFSLDQLIRCLIVHPYVHQLNHNDREAINSVLQYIFQQNIDVSIVKSEKKGFVDDDHISKLGNCNLSWDLTLGSNVWIIDHTAHALILFSEWSEILDQDKFENLKNGVGQIMEWIFPMYFNFEVQLHGGDFSPFILNDSKTNLAYINL